MLIVDNLFDLSHINWVHASVLGRLSIVDRKPVLREGCGVLCYERRETGDLDAFLRFLFPDAIGPVENVLATTMLGPGLITSLGPSVRAAAGGAMAGHVHGDLHFVHVITPETERSTFVMTVITRNFRLADDDLSAAMRRQNDVFLAQDVKTAEAIEGVLGSQTSYEELSFQTDRGGIEARRLLQAMIDSEADQTLLASI